MNCPVCISGTDSHCPERHPIPEDAASEEQDSRERLKKRLSGLVEEAVSRALRESSQRHPRSRAALLEAARYLRERCVQYSVCVRDDQFPENTGPAHMANLLGELEARVDELPLGKLNRWLGFVQGVMCARGWLSVTRERERTRPIFAAVEQEENR
jgi:hypothetical protein